MTEFAGNYSYVLFIKIKKESEFSDIKLDLELPDELKNFIKVTKEPEKNNFVIWTLNVNVGVLDTDLDKFIDWLLDKLPKKMNREFVIFDPQNSRNISFAEYTELKTAIKKHNYWAIYNMGSDSLDLNTEIQYMSPKTKVIVILFFIIIFLYFFIEFIISLLI